MALSRVEVSVELATKYHRNVRGEALNFIDFFYMWDILNDPSPHQVIQAAVQTAKTETFICRMLSDCMLGLSVFYVVPTRDSRNIFVQNRIDRLFDRVPFYRQQVGTIVGESDSTLLKHIGPGVVRFGASQSIGEFKEFPADVLYVDERDVCDPDGLAFAFDRCKGSPYRFRHDLANPTVPGTKQRQNINWMFENSDAKRLHYRCPHCGFVQWLDWFKNYVMEVKHKDVIIDYQLRDEEWRVGGNRDIHPVCQKCGNLFDRTESCVGWIATGDPNHKVSGWQFGRLAPLTQRAEELWDRFKDAVGNHSAMQTFVTSDLGEAYRGDSGNSLSEELMGRCAHDYECPSTYHGPSTMGIDVGTFLDVRISGYVDVKQGEYWVRKRKLLHVGRYRDKEEIYLLMQQYRVAVAVIDSEPESRLSKEIQTVAPCRVWRCMYAPVEGRGARSIRWAVKEGQEAKKGEERLVIVDRTEAMDSVFAQYVREEVMEPRNFTGLLGGEYIGQMTAPVRLLEPSNGRYFWLKCTDHQFHANVYDWLASQDPQAGFITSSSIITVASKSTEGVVERLEKKAQKVVAKGDERIRRKRASVRVPSWKAF